MADDVQTAPTQDPSTSTPDAGTFDWQGAAQSAGGGTGGSDVQVPMRPPEDGSTPVATSAQPTASPNSTGQPSNAAFDDVHPKAVEPMPLPVVHPVRRSGLAGIVDEIRDAIAGKTTTNIGTDAQGNKYVRKDDMTHGQQWMRIASTALHGAAAGMANGQGPGGAGRALAAGVGVADKAAQQKQQMTKDQEQQVKQDQLDKYNMIKMKHDTAAWDFEATRRGIKASQEDLKFAQEQIDHEHTLGSADLGIYKDPTELTKVQQQDPTFWKNVYANNVITVPEIDPASGERKGIHVFLRTPGIGNQLVPKGTPIKTFVPGDKPTDPPKLTTTIPTVPMTQDQVDQYNNAAQTKYSGWQKEQEDLKDKASQRALRDEQTKTQQTEQLKNKGEANKANAEANKAYTEARVLNNASTGDAVNGNAQQLVEGTMDIANLSKRSKTYDATLTAANAYSMQKYGIPFNAAKAAGDYKFATNPQTYNTLNYLNSLTGRDNQGGNLGVVVEMSKKLPRTQFPPLNAVDQWAKLSAGNPQVAAYRAALVEVDDQIAKILQGGGSGGGGTSDAKLKQAAELLNKNFTSEQITAVAQNTLRPLLANRKNEIIGDNRYLQQWHGVQRQPQASPNATAGPVRQGEQVAVGPGGHQIVARGGKWVDPQTGQEVK